MAYRIGLFEDRLKSSRDKINRSRANAYVANIDRAIAQKSDAIRVAASSGCR